MTTLLASPKQKRATLGLVRIGPEEARQPQTESKRHNVDVAQARMRREEFEEVEVELGTRTFWIQKGKLSLHTYEPPIIAYKKIGETELFEVRNWGIEVEVGLAGWSSLPDQLGRRFFEYYSRAQEMALSPEEQLAFARICEAVDYKRFCAEIDPKRYMECTLVRKSTEPRLCSSSGAIHRLNTTLTDSLHVLKDGDYFGAEFTFTPQGTISAIDNLRLLTLPEMAEVDSLLSKRE